MTENQSNKTVLPIKAFKTKVIEFAVMYVIINIISFSGANSVARSVFDNFSIFFTSDLFIDGADFSIFANLFAAPIYLGLIVINIIITLVLDIVLILAFKKLYFKSRVEKEENKKLYNYIKVILLGFILCSFIFAASFFGNLKWIIVYVLVYLPVPVFIFIIVYIKFKKMYNDVQ